MNIIRVRAALAALGCCCLLAACSLLNSLHRAAPPPPPPPAPPQPSLPRPARPQRYPSTPAPPEPSRPRPGGTERFELEPGQTVVGEVQVITAGKDDTLSDIARRFNVGYEEILRANPKVDPWLPGAGHEIVVPTQFILPNAP